MSNFLLLLKINIINNLGLNKLFKNKKNQLTTALIVVLAVFVFLLVLGLITFYFFIFGMMLKEANKAEYIILIGLAVGAFMTILSTLTKGNAYLFKTKDFDLLMSMPIKPHVIVASKVSSLVIFNYLSFAMMFIPALIAYAVLVPTTLVFWLLILLMFFVTPLLPISVCSFISYIVSIFTSRLKYKNLISIVFMLAVFIGIMVLNMGSSAAEEDPTKFANTLINVMKKLYYPAYIAFTGLQGNLLNALIYILLNVVPFILFIFIIGKVYIKFSLKYEQNTKITSKFDVNELKELKSSGEFGTLLKKELKRYFSLPMYVLNTIISPLLVPLMMVLLYFQLGDLSGGEDQIPIEYVALILAALACFMVGMLSTTTSSISLEGKSFWILKSAPVKTKNVFYAKILLYIIVCIPFLIIAAVLSVVLYQIPIHYAIMLFFIPLLQAMLVSTYGLYINVLLPKFNWDSEIKVIKQGASVIVTLLLSFVCDAAVIVPSVFIYMAFQNTFITLLGASVILIVLVVLANVLLLTHGKNRYERLSA